MQRICHSYRMQRKKKYPYITSLLTRIQLTRNKKHRTRATLFLLAVTENCCRQFSSDSSIPIPPLQALYYMAGYYTTWLGWRTVRNTEAYMGIKETKCYSHPLKLRQNLLLFWIQINICNSVILVAEHPIDWF